LDLHVPEIDVILRALGVFAEREGAIRHAEFGESDKWIEVHEFNGTDRTRIGEMDRSGLILDDEK